MMNKSDIFKISYLFLPMTRKKGSEQGRRQNSANAMKREIESGRASSVLIYFTSATIQGTNNEI